MPEPEAIPIICGPTGAGKTEIAIELAERHPIEVISADSRQMIRKLDIGTAKPTPQERARVRFHLLDIIGPGERYTAYQFIDDASRAIEDILHRNYIPVIVGGTGLYLRALTEGIVEIDEHDLTIRERLDREMEQLGAERMYDRLAKIDPLEAAKLHPDNKVRIIRALEIYYLTGKPKSELVATGAYRKTTNRFEYFCLIPERQALYDRIEQRVDRMMQSGLLEEVQNLCCDGLQEPIKKANVIGYNELLACITGDVTLPEAVRLIKQNSRRYAKRQITWFRHQIKAKCFAEKSKLVAGAKIAMSSWRIADESA